MYCVFCGKEINDDNVPCYYCGKKQPKEPIEIIHVRDDEELFKQQIKSCINNDYELKSSNMTIEHYPNVQNVMGLYQFKIVPKYHYYAIMIYKKE